MIFKNIIKYEFYKRPYIVFDQISYYSKNIKSHQEICIDIVQLDTITNIAL